MIRREFNAEGTLGRFIVRPHRSATWRDNLWLVACVAGVAVPLALVWTLVGFWPILPLCFLYLALLVALLYRVNYALLAQEVITFERDAIIIEAGRRSVERRFDLQRAWTWLRLEPGMRRGYPDQLILRSRGRAVELGRFLTDDERSELAGDLKDALARSPRPPTTDA